MKPFSHSLFCQVFVESLDRAFENVCELDLVFHFDEASHFFMSNASPITDTSLGSSCTCRAHSGWVGSGDECRRNRKLRSVYPAKSASVRSPLTELTVQQAAKARKDSYVSANPLSLGVGGGAMGTRGTGLQTPLGWLTTKLVGSGAR